MIDEVAGLTQAGRDDDRPGRAAGISVIIPTYNDGDLLERCIDSVAAQTLAPLEVIVVDDGSTHPDARAGIARAVRRHPWVRLIRQRNAGPSAARNRGLAACGGDWVAFVDADDVLVEDSLEQRMALVDDDDVAASYAGIRFIEPDGREHVSRYLAGRGPLPIARIGDGDGVPGFLWAYLIRTAALRRIGGLDERLSIMEDFDLLARLGRDGAIVTGGPGLAYVQHRRRGSLARGSAWRQWAGTLRFLAKARREGYFTKRELARRYLRAPLAAAKVAVRYSLRGG